LKSKAIIKSEILIMLRFGVLIRLVA